MQIGLIIYGSLDTVSGGFLYDRKLVEYLLRQGDSVEIISLPWRNYISHLADNFSGALRLRLQQARFDLLLQDELNHASLFHLNQRLRGRIQYPIVSIVHHLRSLEQRPAWQNSFYYAVERRYLSSVDAFIINSQTTRHRVEQVGADTRAHPSCVAYPAGDRFGPAIDEGGIEPRAMRPGPLQIVFLGNFIPRKGLHTLLEAIRLLPPDEFKLAVVGNMQVDRNYSDSILRQVKRWRLENRVQLYGPLGDDELAKLLSCGHILCVPSTYEGFGIVYLEGMGFGLPAIATTAGAAGEIITHGQNGFLVPPADAETLAANLAVLATNRQRLASMSLAARQRFTAHPTWEQTAEKIRGFLSGVVESSRI